MTVKKVLFVSKGMNASTRYRALQFYPFIERKGFVPSHVIASGGLFAMLNTLWQASQADVVVVIRKTFPSLITLFLGLISKRLVFDFDDAIFCNSHGVASRTRMSRFKTMIEQCEHVSAGNQFLANKAAEHNDHVSLVPTCLDTDKYDIEIDKPKDFIDLVWIGSESTSKYLKDLIPVLDSAVVDIPQLRLKIIADFTITDSQIPVIAIPWSEEGEAGALANSHIGIAPMIDNDWTRGKCALKVLQYMAAGLPVISSNVGVNGEAVIDGVSGSLVTTDDEWLAAIKRLALDEALRVQMGKESKQRVKEIYDIEIVADKFISGLLP